MRLTEQPIQQQVDSNQQQQGQGMQQQGQQPMSAVDKQAQAVQQKKQNLQQQQASVAGEEAAVAQKQADQKKAEAQRVSQAQKQQGNMPAQGQQRAYMKNTRRRKTKKSNESLLIAGYRETVERASRFLDEEHSLMKRPDGVGPGEQAHQDRDELNANDDLSALKNKTVLKYLGFEVGKDDEVERASRILGKFEKILPKLKMAFSTLRKRLVQDEHAKHINMNLRDREMADAKERQRQKEVNQMAGDPRKMRR